MNRILKSRTIRIPCSVVAPPPEEPALSLPKGPALPALSGAEGSAAEVEPPCGRERSKSPQAKSRAQPRDQERSEGLALSEPERLALSEAEGARPPHPRRHARLCTICCHPDRDAIEEDFIHWRSPSDIAIDYNLPDRSSVYRHAHATGLFARRSRNLRFVLERLLERVDKVKVTAHAVVRAVRAYTRINDEGQWVEPPTRIIVTSGSPPVARSPALLASTEHAERLALSEAQPAPGKARAKPHSNRHRRPQSP